MKNDLISVRDELKSFAEEYKSQMSVNCYEYIWGVIQGIDRKLENDI